MADLENGGSMDRSMVEWEREFREAIVLIVNHAGPGRIAREDKRREKGSEIKLWITWITSVDKKGRVARGVKGGRDLEEVERPLLNLSRNWASGRALSCIRRVPELPVAHEHPRLTGSGPLPGT